ncbi:ATP synthase membrane subunit K, mitochondrial [Labeo rohita]|uniref:ATP synthase membrane subunit K, mitochondrial n=1 Tax=Labeo rohita TaxID=84645 RepID=A0ABQ8N060_LABRO|nr:ATP synthase membrane subunit K, mitochondrial [Labeo rohita]
MGGHDAGTHHQFTGIAKYFNSYTITGRRNCVLATYASIAAIILFFKLKPKKQKAVKSRCIVIKLGVPEAGCPCFDLVTMVQLCKE